MSFTSTIALKDQVTSSTEAFCLEHANSFNQEDFLLIANAINKLKSYFLEMAKDLCGLTRTIGNISRLNIQDSPAQISNQRHLEFLRGLFEIETKNDETKTRLPSKLRTSLEARTEELLPADAQISQGDLFLRYKSLDWIEDLVRTQASFATESKAPSKNFSELLEALGKILRYEPKKQRPGKAPANHSQPFAFKSFSGTSEDELQRLLQHVRAAGNIINLAPEKKAPATYTGKRPKGICSEVHQTLNALSRVASVKYSFLEALQQLNSYLQLGSKSSETQALILHKRREAALTLLSDLGVYIAFNRSNELGTRYTLMMNNYKAILKNYMPERIPAIEREEQNFRQMVDGYFQAYNKLLPRLKEIALYGELDTEKISLKEFAEASSNLIHFVQMLRSNFTVYKQSFEKINAEIIKYRSKGDTKTQKKAAKRERKRAQRIAPLISKDGSLEVNLKLQPFKPASLPYYEIPRDLAQSFVDNNLQNRNRIMNLFTRKLHPNDKALFLKLDKALAGKNRSYFAVLKTIDQLTVPALASKLINAYNQALESPDNNLVLNEIEKSFDQKERPLLKIFLPYALLVLMARAGILNAGKLTDLNESNLAAFTYNQAKHGAELLELEKSYNIDPNALTRARTSYGARRRRS